MQPLFCARLSHRGYNYLSSNDQPGKITGFMLCLENNVLLQIDGSFACKRASLTALEQLPLFRIPVPFFAAHFTLGKLGWMLRRQRSLPLPQKRLGEHRSAQKVCSRLDGISISKLNSDCLAPSSLPRPCDPLGPDPKGLQALLSAALRRGAASLPFSDSSQCPAEGKLLQKVGCEGTCCR